MSKYDNMASANERDEWTRTRQEAWRRFGQGDFSGALEQWLRLSVAGVIVEPELQALVEVLFDRGDAPAAAEAIRRVLEQEQSPSARTTSLRWTATLFDLETLPEVESAGSCESARRLLEDLAAHGSEADWNAIFSRERQDICEQSCETPLDLLDLLEQEALAPSATGLPDQARARIEEIGHVHADRQETARAAERLLHALGDAPAAYRVEGSRRAFAVRSATARHDSKEPLVRLGGLQVAIAGGHPALRSLIERDLRSAGVSKVKAIPSATEASRVGRDVQAALAGVDVVVLLVRQLAHSTSDQVRKAASRVGVPVVVAESSGISSVRRAIEHYARARSGS